LQKLRSRFRLATQARQRLSSMSPWGTPRMEVEELTEKRDEIHLMKESYEQEMKAMREEMEKKFQELFTRIDVTKLT
jgi:hypothetical protein